MFAFAFLTTCAIWFATASVRAEMACTRAQYRDVLAAYVIAFNQRSWFQLRNTHAPGAQLLIGVKSPYLRNALNTAELECIANQVTWSVVVDVDDADFTAANSATVTVKHIVTSVQLHQAVRMQFSAQERFTFSKDPAQCRIVLHELAWSAVDPDVLMLNALIHPCLKA